MKTLFYKSMLFAVITAGFLTSCVNDDDYDVPQINCEETSLVKTMEPQAVPAPAVAALYNGPEGSVIEAYVVSSDIGGNFFKSISLQTLDGSFGFSVPVDVTSVFAKFEPGRKVFVQLKSATDTVYTDLKFGSLRIGTLFEGQVGRLSQSQYENVLQRSCTVVSEDSLVQKLTVAQTLNDARINTLIELQNVKFEEDAHGETYFDANNQIGGATNYNLVDVTTGATIIFRTSSFASYAGATVPNGTGNVRGVLTKFNSDYQFVARTLEDVKIINTAPQPGEEPVGPGTAFYTEDFQASIDNTDFDLPGWSNIVQSGVRKWSEQAFEGNGYAEFSAFGSNNALNEAWLVSPAIDMNAHTGETFRFDAAMHHLDGDTEGNKLEVFVFTSFNGTDAAGATKVNVTGLANLPTTANEWYEFVASGEIDLSSYTGNIYIAFKYTGSGSNTDFDGAFQIDNLVVSGN